MVKRPDKNFQPSSPLLAMDSEARIRQLEEDLRNAREMISCLSDTVKSVAITAKLGKNEDLHGKIDKLLENQCAIKREMQNFGVKIDNVAKEVAECKAVKHLIDSVETSVGYQELFVKDFEKIQAKIGGMEDSFGGFNTKLEKATMALNVQIKRTENFEHKLEVITANVENVERNLERIIQDEQSIVNLKKKMEQDLAEKINAILKQNKKMKGTMETEINAVKLQSVNSEIVNVDRKFATNKVCLKNFKDHNYKCHICRRPLSKPLALRKDGVSVTCSKCHSPNIVGKLEEGNKWMIVTSYSDQEEYYQQFSVDKEETEEERCRECGTLREIFNANRDIALPC